jgi:hypothetical protein
MNEPTPTQVKREFYFFNGPILGMHEIERSDSVGFVGGMGSSDSSVSVGTGCVFCILMSLKMR